MQNAISFLSCLHFLFPLAHLKLLKKSNWMRKKKCGLKSSLTTHFFSLESGSFLVLSLFGFFRKYVTSTLIDQGVVGRRCSRKKKSIQFFYWDFKLNTRSSWIFEDWNKDEYYKVNWERKLSFLNLCQKDSN